MSLKERLGHFDIRETADVALIVDASETAGNYRKEIVQLTNQLIDSLPPGCAHDLFFLGCSTAYETYKFSQNSGLWWETHKNSGSYFAPVAKNLHDNDRIILIGNGPVYDLEDWTEKPFAENIIFAKMGNSSLRGSIETGEEMGNPNAQDIMNKINNPIISITIKGENFLPYYWDNPIYHLIKTTDSNFELTVKRTEKQQIYGITVGFFGEKVIAEVQRESGINKVTFSAGTMLPPRWDDLDDIGKEVFKNAIVQQNYLCPRCKQEHAAHQLICSNEGIWGRCVYSSFGINRGIFMLKEESQRVLYSRHFGTAIRLSGNSAAVLDGRKLIPYHFDSDENKWLAGEAMSPYYCLDNKYLLAI